MRHSSIAARYARALFLTTEKRRETARALEDVQSLAGVLAPETRAARFLATPEIRLADKRQALRTATEGKALPIVVVFLDLLLRKKRLNLLSTIVDEYRELVERAQGIERVHVVSATPLTKPEMDRLLAELERLTGSRVLLTTDVDSSLIGGVLVRIGDRVIDRTVRTLLEAIEKQLHEVSV